MKRRAGLSLVEIVIALFLVAAALAAVLSVVPGLQRRAAQEQDRHLAGTVARGIVEALRTVPYGATVPPHLLAPQRFDSVVEGVATRVVIEVKEIRFEPAAPGRLAADPAAAASRVRVVVTWAEGTGASSTRAVKELAAWGVVVRP